jgi:hypothetical protein
MGRIRTIKPELPWSERLGTVSRDARLSLILLLTLADDSGRTRGAFAYLSGQLFPYDEDAPKNIGAWMQELDKIGSIVCYEVDGSRYVQITNWHKHQKIEKPTASRLPQFDDSSPKCRRVFPDSSPPGSRTVDQGSSIKDQEEATSKSETQPDDQLALPGAAAPPPGSDKPKRSRPRKPVDPIMIPDALASHPGFLEQWAAWEAYRRESKKTLTASTRNSQLLLLSRHGPAKAMEMMSRSITNGWTGLFPSDDARGHSGARRASNESTEYRGAKPLPEDQQEKPF